MFGLELDMEVDLSTEYDLEFKFFGCLDNEGRNTAPIIRHSTAATN
jgi:hypothetical protein